MVRMKRLALGLLLFVTVVFLLTRWQEEQRPIAPEGGTVAGH